MTDKLPPLSPEDLLSLVKGRKFKDYSRYIREIQNMIEAAENSMATVLKNILVDKLEKDPTVILNALVLYKALIISASFDYTFNDQYFPQSVHAEVIRICQYKPNIETFSSRGSDYFIDTLKIPKTEQNKDMLERTGNSYVLMALELVQAMAGLYPQDYNSKTPSFFKASYDELLRKKVTFPNREQHLIIKKTDQDNFKINYERYKKRMQELDEEEESSPQKKVQKNAPPPPKKQDLVDSKIAMKPTMAAKDKVSAPGNSLNISPSNVPLQSSGDMVILKGQVTSSVTNISKHPAIDPLKKEINSKDPSMVVIPNIFATNQLPQSSKPNPTLSKQVPKEVKQEREIKQQREVFKQSDEDDEDIPVPKESSARFGKIDETKPKKQTLDSKVINPNSSAKPNPLPSTNPSPVSFVKPPTEEPKPKTIEVAKPPPQPIRQTVPKPQAVPQQPQPQKKQVPSVKPEQPAKKPEKAEDIPRPPKEEVAVSVVKDLTGPKSSPQQVPKQQGNSMNINSKYEEPIGENVFSFTQKDFAQTAKRDSVTPRKIAKIEKSSGISSVQISPSQEQKDQKPHRRSLPKTERPFKTVQHFYPNQNVHLYKAVDYVETLQSPTPKGQFNKTLSEYAKKRPKYLPAKKLEKAQSLQLSLNELKLDVRHVPFIPQYYEPITRSMRALRVESLTLFNSGTSGNQFFTNGLIQCRIVKEGNCVFSLMLQNVSQHPLLVEYCEMKTLRYSNRIKILSWANRPQIGPYEVSRKGFMDIRFRFSVGDLNFKFLTFLLRINGKVESLVLPVTLLDMCELNTQLPDLYHFSLNGSIIASEPFLLTERGLPPFLGGFRFTPLSDSRGKRQRGQVVGQGSLRWEGEEGVVEVGVLVRVADWQERRVEVSIIHQVRRQESQDLAKVVLYLLVFLLEQD